MAKKKDTVKEKEKATITKMVYNSTERVLTLRIREKDGKVTKVKILPGKTEEVATKFLRAAKKNKIYAHYLNEQMLILGSKKKAVKLPDDFLADLEEEEED